jgi:hypothetical protein
LPGAVFFNGFDERVPHIHGNGFNARPLAAAQLVEKAFQGFGFAVFADKQYAAADEIQYDGQVVVASSQRDFIHGQEP